MSPDEKVKIRRKIIFLKDVYRIIYHVQISYVKILTLNNNNRYNTNRPIHHQISGSWNSRDYNCCRFHELSLGYLKLILSRQSCEAGADPNFLTVVACRRDKHEPVGRLPLGSAMPMVTLSVAKYRRLLAGITLYCLATLTEAHVCVCEQLAQKRYVNVNRSQFEPATSQSRVQRPAHYRAPRHIHCGP